MPPGNPSPQGSADTTTQSEAGDVPGGNDAETTGDQSAAIPHGSGWITTEVAAAALGGSPRTVRDYIRSGDLGNPKVKALRSGGSSR
jgi:hypothetical protein